MPEAVTLLLQLAALVWVFVLPGALVAFQLDAEWSRPVRLAAGLALGALVVPMACFCVAWALGTNVRPPLVVGVATVLNAAGYAALRLRRRASAPAGATRV